MSPSKLSALERASIDVLLEIGRYLTVEDIFSLRATSKFLWAFSSARPLWLIAATNVSRKRPLPLPTGHFLVNSSTEAVIEATIKANSLHSIFSSSEPGVIRPRLPIRAFHMKPGPPPPILEFNMWDEDKLFIHDGRYFAVISDRGVALWDIFHGRKIGSFGIAAFGLLEAITLSNQDGTESVIIASHSTGLRTYPAIPSGGHFTIMEMVVPKSKFWSSPILLSHSIPVAMTVTGIFMDDRYIVATGPTTEDLPTASFILIPQRSHDAVIVNTGMSVQRDTVFVVVVTSSRLVLHAELENTSHVFTYELDVLLEHLTKGTSSCSLAPNHTRTAALDVLSHNSPPLYWDTFILPNALGTGRAGQDFKPCVTWLSQTEGNWVVSYHVLDHLFDDSSSGGVRSSVTIPEGDIMISDFVQTMLWALPGGCVVYVTHNGHEPELILIAFAFDGSSKESKVHLPSFIDLSKLCEVDMNKAWGVLGLYMADTTVYMINFV